MAASARTATSRASLNLLKIPIPIPGLMASALAMDKPVAKRIFAAGGPARAGGQPAHPRRVHGGRSAAAPLCREAVQRRLQRRRHHHQGRATTPTPSPASTGRSAMSVLAERFIPGRELTVGVMGDKRHGGHRAAAEVRLLRLRQQIYRRHDRASHSGAAAGRCLCRMPAHGADGASGAGLPRRARAPTSATTTPAKAVSARSTCSKPTPSPA